MYEDMTANVDQAGAGLKQIAPMIAELHKGLRKQDLPRFDAALITAMWAYGLIGGFGKADKQEDD